MTADTPRAGVVGWPIGHSRSPLIHGYWLKRYGLSGSYEAFPVRPEDFQAFIERLRAGSHAGCNVTVPHKEAALALSDTADAAARAIGAANTLVVRDGQVHASNTDAPGFLASLDQSAPGWDDASGSAVVLGAGGAARAIVQALLDRGLDRIRIINRTRERAEALCAHFGARPAAADWTERHAALGDASLLINSTTLGMAGAPPLDIDFAALPGSAVVTDIVYAPLETALLAAARAKGCRAVDGLGMLLHQAVPGFAAWFGTTPDVTEELRRIVIADLETNP